MFDNAQEPKDMFVDVPDQSSGAKPVPAPAALQSVQPQPQVMSPAQAMQYGEPKKGGGFRWVAAVVISLLCVGAAGYAAYRFMIRDAVSQPVSDVINGNTDTTESDSSDSNSDTPPQTPTTSDVADTPDDTDTSTGTTAVVDSDGDGLSNDEERIAGTSVAKPDTDGDDLGDREELKKYDTDPKKTDTDGDGYTDGEEVKNGYNPNGEGRLLQIPE